jgi:hypothetical protein
MSKTPYEIRLELLKLANEILVTPVHQKRDVLLQEWHSKISASPEKSIPLPDLPNFPRTEDVITEAERLNRFVSQN